MSNEIPDAEWIYNFIPKEEVMEINARLAKTCMDFKVVLNTTVENAIELCVSHVKAKEGDVPSMMYVMAFINYFISRVEVFLDEIGRNPYDSQQ